MRHFPTHAIKNYTENDKMAEECSRLRHVFVQGDHITQAEELRTIKRPGSNLADGISRVEATVRSSLSGSPTNAWSLKEHSDLFISLPAARQSHHLSSFHLACLLFFPQHPPPSFLINPTMSPHYPPPQIS